MEASERIRRIIRSAGELSPSEREIVIKELNKIESKKKGKKKYSLTDLEGLGAEIWRETSVEEYLDNERKWD